MTADGFALGAVLDRRRSQSAGTEAVRSLIKKNRKQSAATVAAA
jgi:hypothetical protein